MYENSNNLNPRLSVTNPLETRLVVLPHWLLKAVEAYGKPLTTVLDAKELLNILLLEDVAKYMYLNHRLLDSNNNVMEAMRGTFDTCFMYGEFGNNLETSDLRSQLRDLIQILPEKMSIANSNSMLDENAGRLDSGIAPRFLNDWKIWELVGLFSGVADKTEIEAYKASRGFELVYIDEHHMGLKLVKGNPKINPDRLLVENLDNCMGVLNQYYEFNDVSRTALFDLFMKYTSQQTLSI